MNYRMLLTALLLIGAPLSAQDASVTLFNSGRVLVRRTLPGAVAAGTSSKTLPLGMFDPASLTSLDAGVSISRVTYDPVWTEEALLRRSVGRTFTYINPRNNQNERATLLALDPERWRLENGGMVVFSRPGQLQWPADLVPSAPTADVQIESDRARTSLNLLYQTQGASWAAKYRIFVGTTARVEGSAQIGSGTLDLTNAEVQLLAGDIGQPPSGSPMPRMELQSREMSMAKSADAFASEEAVGEAHLYTLPGRVTFVPGTQTVLPLFAPATAKAERRYTVRGALPYYGGFGQETEEQIVPVEVSWRLDRKTGTPFGDVPLPGGSVAVFDVDKAGRTQLIGQGSISHTAAGEVLTVRTGTAFDVTAKRTQTEFTTARTPTGNRTVATMGYLITLQNAKDSSVRVEVYEERGGEWSVLTSSLPAQKRSSSRTAFVVTVPAKGSATLTYRVRAVW